jgi:hypothetical protein
MDRNNKMVQVKAGSTLIPIGCPTSGVAQRSLREAAPHTRGVSKATLRSLAAVKIDKLFRTFSLSPFSGKMTLNLYVEGQSPDGVEANRPLSQDERDGS